jgi:predicted peptidase
LLVFLHGSGESGDGSAGFQLAKLTGTAIPQMIQVNRWPDDRPFVVLSPQHDEDPPNFCMEASEIDDFLTFALEQYNIDPDRVYLTGLSCGATGLWNFLAQGGGDRVAAAIPVAGFGLAPVSMLGCDLGTTPIWAFHGAADDVVPVHGAVYPITQLQACTDPPPVDARLTVYPLAGHDSWTRTYQRIAEDDIYNWMLSHSR